MGKTYESLIDDEYGVDLYEDDMNLEMDVDEDMEIFLEDQTSISHSKSRKTNHANKSAASADDEFNKHRLPRDWQDFDYAPESSLDDDWQ